MMRAPLRRVIFAPGQRFTAAAKVARARSRSLAPLAASLLSTRPGFHFTARSRQHAHGSLRRSDNRGAHAAFAASDARWRSLGVNRDWARSGPEALNQAGAI